MKVMRNVQLCTLNMRLGNDDLLKPHRRLAGKEISKLYVDVVHAAAPRCEVDIDMREFVSQLSTEDGSSGSRQNNPTLRVIITSITYP
jgi:hypothetical protein